MVLLEHEKVVIVSGLPDLYVKDEDYLLLINDKELRKEFLTKLGKESVKVDRLGKELEDNSVFERKELKVKVPEFSTRREMGYYHRL